MPFFQKLFCVIVIGIGSILLAGCATSNKKDYGNSMQSIGGKAQELGEQWTEGEELIGEGNKLVKQSMMDKAKGENMIKKGMQMQAESERMFKETYQRIYQNSPNR